MFKEERCERKGRASAKAGYLRLCQVLRSVGFGTCGFLPDPGPPTQATPSTLALSTGTLRPAFKVPPY
eukprot:1160562-Pelagomonas_calceolata.AAC.4